MNNNYTDMRPQARKLTLTIVVVVAIAVFSLLLLLIDGTFSPALIVASIFGIVAPIIWTEYQNSLSTKKLSWSQKRKDATKDLENWINAGKLKLDYTGKVVGNIWITRIAIVNDGEEDIQREDLSEKNKLQIYAGDEVEVLEMPHVIHNSSKSTRAIITKENSSYIVDFEHLESGHTLIVEVVHTGKAVEFQVSGRIIGTKKSSPIHKEAIRKVKLSSVNKQVRFRWALTKGLLFVTASLLVIATIILVVTVGLLQFDASLNSNDQNRVFVELTGIYAFNVLRVIIPIMLFITFCVWLTYRYASFQYREIHTLFGAFAAEHFE